jgi:asparagine synthase (glutamine-hydrolysing)
MAGIGGVVGSQVESVDDVGEYLAWQGSERRRTVDGERAALTTVTHPQGAGGVCETDAFDVHVWGNVWGRHSPNGYRSRHREYPGLTAAEYCAKRYADRGVNFVGELNGDFAGAIFDEEAETVYLVTDRLGSRPFYLAPRDADGTVVFSSLIQSLYEVPGLTARFDCEYLTEFLHFNRSFGETTPLCGVTQSPPATVVAIDTGSREITEERYWYPDYEPRDQPYGAFVREFVAVLKRVVADHTRGAERPGLM